MASAEHLEPQQFTSYLPLLRPVPDRQWDPRDTYSTLLVVPSVRGSSAVADTIEAAFTVNESGGALVMPCILHSDQPSRAETTKVLQSHGTDMPWINLHVPADYEHPLFDFRTSTFPEAIQRRRSDLSRKRNIGLVLGETMGASRTMFLDDDLYVAPADMLTAIKSALPILDGGMIGFSISGMPDNSVARHANRSVGNPQDVFISGNSLVFHRDWRSRSGNGRDMRRVPGFFPEIYNEDWLFLYDHVAFGFASRMPATARQQPYDPFAQPERAEGEEFGELIAEGMYTALLHNRHQNYALDVDYWQGFKTARQTFLHGLIDQVSVAELPDDHKQALTASLERAHSVSRAISAVACETYVGQLFGDMQRWYRKWPIPWNNVGDNSPLKLADMLRIHRQSFHPTLIEHSLGSLGLLAYADYQGASLALSKNLGSGGGA